MIPQTGCRHLILRGLRKYISLPDGRHADSPRTDPEANDHLPSSSIVLAVLGSLSLEFTRLAQITGNDKYFDGIQKIMNELEKWQDQTVLPGMWPAMVKSDFYNESILIGSPYVGGEEQYTLGALADSTYEYLPKVSNHPRLL